MLLSGPFQKFVEASPVSGIIENLFHPERIERLFEETAVTQYTNGAAATGTQHFGGGGNGETAATGNRGNGRGGNGRRPVRFYNAVSPVGFCRSAFPVGFRARSAFRASGSAVRGCCARWR